MLIQKYNHEFHLILLGFGLAIGAQIFVLHGLGARIEVSKRQVFTARPDGCILTWTMSHISKKRYQKKEKKKKRKKKKK